MGRLLRFVPAIVSATLLTSCLLTTNRIEYVERSAPDIVFPVFPTLEGAVRNSDGTVTVPEEWIVRLAEYKVRIEETEKTFTETRRTNAD